LKNNRKWRHFVVRTIYHKFLFIEPVIVFKAYSI
jgi:hypothetical protein